MHEDCKIFGIIGYPVSHSLSPAMHHAAFEAAKINAVYVALEARELNNAVKFMNDAGFSGFNITMPYKENILKYAKAKSKEVEAIGAANTAVLRSGKIYLYNTDYLAAKKLISGKMNVKGKKALVIGAGGAAKAIIYALKQLKADVYVMNRTFSKAKNLVKKFRIRAISEKEICSNTEKYSFAIITNATPLGMGKMKNRMPCRKQLLENAELVYESVYHPAETLLLKEAKNAGCKTINGLDMLLEQGAEAFALFTGKEAPKNVMKEALIKGLNEL